MLSNTTNGSGTDKKFSGPIKDLSKKIRIVFANGASSVDCLISVRDENEFWFESKSDRLWAAKQLEVEGV
jgi:hypothetical protein